MATEIGIPVFLEMLAETPRYWVLVGEEPRLAVGGPNPACPVSALKERPAYEAWEIASDVGLSDEDFDLIVVSADNVAFGKAEPEPELRAKVLAACGLDGGMLEAHHDG